MPARAFTTYRSAGPVLPEFLSNLKNLFKVAYIYLYQGCAERIQNSENFIILKGGLLNIFICGDWGISYKKKFDHKN